MIKELLNLSCEWISLSCAPISAIGATIDTIQSVSDKILFSKLYSVLEKQDGDFNEWLKISENFEKDHKSYEKMVKQLIFYINAINEIDMLNAFANLLHAYKCGLICKSDFLRMGFCLTKLLAEDAHYLSDNIHRDKIPENIFVLSLAAQNLMYDQSRGTGKADTERYSFTKMGRMLDKYALSFADESKYSYKNVDSELCTQTLSYGMQRHVCDIKGNILI